MRRVKQINICLLSDIVERIFTNLALDPMNNRLYTSCFGEIFQNPSRTATKSRTSTSTYCVRIDAGAMGWEIINMYILATIMTSSGKWTFIWYTFHYTLIQTISNCTTTVFVRKNFTFKRPWRIYVCDETMNLSNCSSTGVWSLNNPPMEL